MDLLVKVINSLIESISLLVVIIWKDKSNN